MTTEEEGIGVVTGSWLGGQRAALLMQSSGVGNCVNMFSLLDSCRVPFLTLVTMRGEYAEFNPWQGPMGRRTQGGHRVAARIRAGTVWVNCYRAVAPSVPFGGVGLSGIGRENGAEAVAEYTEIKSVWVELTGGTRDPFTLG